MEGIGEGWGVEHCKNAGEGGRRGWCQIINGTWEYLQPALYGGDIAIGDQLQLYSQAREEFYFTEFSNISLNYVSNIHSLPGVTILTDFYLGDWGKVS